MARWSVRCSGDEVMRWSGGQVVRWSGGESLSQDLHSAMKMLGLNPMEQEIIDMTNEITRWRPDMVTR